MKDLLTTTMLQMPAQEEIASVIEYPSRFKLAKVLQGLFLQQKFLQKFVSTATIVSTAKVCFYSKSFNRILQGFKKLFRLSGSRSVEVVMISKESTTKDVKLFGYDFRGHTRGTPVVGIAYGCPYYKGSAIFSLVFF